ncbi:hypothetical protein LA080_015190 [Diaporthe eres]|nr:hypothetical protein LA080_015190 [Diaporthe eres]
MQSSLQAFILALVSVKFVPSRGRHALSLRFRNVETHARKRRHDQLESGSDDALDAYPVRELPGLGQTNKHLTPSRPLRVLDLGRHCNGGEATDTSTILMMITSRLEKAELRSPWSNKSATWLDRTPAHPCNASWRSAQVCIQVHVKLENLTSV